MLGALGDGVALLQGLAKVLLPTENVGPDLDRRLLQAEAAAPLRSVAGHLAEPEREPMLTVRAARPVAHRGDANQQ